MWSAVIDKHHTMTDEHFIFDRNAGANEAVTGHLASFTHGDAALNFDERADVGVSTDCAAVQVDERAKCHARP
jgi:hypothetical protein